MPKVKRTIAQYIQDRDKPKLTNVGAERKKLTVQTHPELSFDRQERGRIKDLLASKLKQGYNIDIRSNVAESIFNNWFVAIEKFVTSTKNKDIYWLNRSTKTLKKYYNYLCSLKILELPDMHSLKVKQWQRDFIKGFDSLTENQKEKVRQPSIGEELERIINKQI